MKTNIKLCTRSFSVVALPVPSSLGQDNLLGACAQR